MSAASGVSLPLLHELRADTSHAKAYRIDRHPVGWQVVPAAISSAKAPAEEGERPLMVQIFFPIKIGKEFAESRASLEVPLTTEGILKIKALRHLFKRICPTYARELYASLFEHKILACETVMVKIETTIVGVILRFKPKEETGNRLYGVSAFVLIPAWENDRPLAISLAEDSVDEITSLFFNGIESSTSLGRAHLYAGYQVVPFVRGKMKIPYCCGLLKRDPSPLTTEEKGYFMEMSKAEIRPDWTRWQRSVTLEQIFYASVSVRESRTTF